MFFFFWFWSFLLRIFGGSRDLNGILFWFCFMMMVSKGMIKRIGNLKKIKCKTLNKVRTWILITTNLIHVIFKNKWTKKKWFLCMLEENFDQINEQMKKILDLWGLWRREWKREGNRINKATVECSWSYLCACWLCKYTDRQKLAALLLLGKIVNKVLLWFLKNNDCLLNLCDLVFWTVRGFLLVSLQL